MNKVIFIAFLSFLATSCRTVKTEAPDILVNENYEIPEQPVSVVKVPVKIDLAPYFKETNKSVPKKFDGKDYQCEGVSYKYHFERKDIKFKGVGKELKFSVNGGYSIFISYCPECTSIFSSTESCILPVTKFSCGINEPLRKLRVSFKSKIGVTPDYHLKSRTHVSDVKALSPCEVTLFQYDATSRVEKEVKKAMKDVVKDIDKEIGATNLRPDMEIAWNAMEAPIDMEGYGYMFLNPRAVGMSNITYYGDTAYLDTYLQAYPEVRLDTIGFRPTKLPDLTKFEVSDGFDVKMDISATYDSLSNILTRDISGMKTDINGKEIIFKEVEIHGAADHQLHLKIGFDGKKRGTLFLTGTPVFNDTTQVISFPDLEFDIKTRSALLKGAKWLFDKKITNMIRDAATIDLTEYLEEFKSTVDTSLNGEVDDGVYMNGSVREIRIKHIIPQEDVLFMRVSSKGQIKVKM